MPTMYDVLILLGGAMVFTTWSFALFAWGHHVGARAHHEAVLPALERLDELGGKDAFKETD